MCHLQGCLQHNPLQQQCMCNMSRLPITHSRQPLANLIAPTNSALQKSPMDIINKWSMPVLDKDTGQLMEYHQLRKHPKFSDIWNTSWSNEMGYLCQREGKFSDCKSWLVLGNDTFHVINYDNIPANRQKEIFYTLVVCKVFRQKTSLIDRALQLVAIKFATLEMSERQWDTSNLSS